MDEQKLSKMSQLQRHIIGGDKIKEKRVRDQVDGTIRSFEAKKWDYLLNVDLKWLSVIVNEEMTDYNSVD